MKKILTEVILLISFLAIIVMTYKNIDYNDIKISLAVLAISILAMLLFYFYTKQKEKNNYIIYRGHFFLIVGVGLNFAVFLENSLAITVVIVLLLVFYIVFFIKKLIMSKR